MERTHVTVGPFGGQGGKAWDDGIFTGIRKLIIHSRKVIHSIQIEYDHNGKSILSQKRGGPDGDEKTVELDYPSEYFLSIWGYYSSDSARACVQSLTIESNKKPYGPFGTEKGKYFKFPLTSGKIVGFHGTSGLYLDSIGAYFEPFSNAHQPMIVGPFGGYGGNQWDDGIHTAVRQLIINAGVDINSIEIEYDKDGQSVSRTHGESTSVTRPHGESSSVTSNTVKFDYPDEFLVSMSGYYSLETAFVSLQSLTLHSNKRKWGPFGTEIGNHFTFPAPYPGSKIIGLHGRSGSHLDAIGAYFMAKPIQSPIHPYITVGPFGGQGGVEWDDGKYRGVKQLIIYASSAIDSIQIEYDDDGNSKLSEKHGTRQVGAKYTVKLDYPDEFLLSIRGYYTVVYNIVVVCSLTIKSNKKTYGPFGLERGYTFESPQITGKIVGFYGRSGDLLDSIGAHFESLVRPSTN